MHAGAPAVRFPEPTDVFTQCPQCETIFRLSADALAAAGGQVRCGRCGEVFDSLQRLAEEPGIFVVGESTLELEARAEQILETDDDEPESAGPSQAQADAAGFVSDFESSEDVASLEIQDPGYAADVAAAPADRSLEFSLTPTDLDRIFVEAPGDHDYPHDDVLLTGDESAAGEAPPGGDQYREEETADRGAFAERGPGVEGAYPRVAPWMSPPAAAATQPQHWPYVFAILLLSLLLAAQVGHHYREWLASRTPFGSMIRRLYAELGQPLPVPATLTGYELRQWGVSGDASASGTLRVRASILNTTARAQPFPLLRVTLEDRFGAHLGTHDFEPAEYSGKLLTRLLGPGERADATVEVPDPGKVAEGFELDVCLRGADGRVICASEPAARSP
jgi:predicted Zn finger-like uncharacterized protein